MNAVTLLVVADSGSVLTYNKNHLDPRMDPCGTPEETGRALGVALRTVTRCLQLMSFHASYTTVLVG